MVRILSHSTWYHSGPRKLEPTWCLDQRWGIYHKGENSDFARQTQAFNLYPQRTNQHSLWQHSLQPQIIHMLHHGCWENSTITFTLTSPQPILGSTSAKTPLHTTTLDKRDILVSMTAFSPDGNDLHLKFCKTRMIHPLGHSTKQTRISMTWIMCPPSTFMQNFGKSCKLACIQSHPQRNRLLSKFQSWKAHGNSRSVRGTPKFQHSNYVDSLTLCQFLQIWVTSN